MNNWERWAKRIVKGIIWLVAFLALAWALEVPPTWRVMFLVVVCSLIDDILGIALPTDALTTSQRGTE
jgi:hypothetical protein